jgi:hypothetical protein
MEPPLAVAAAADDGPMTDDRVGPDDAPAMDRSRSASWRSAAVQSSFPDITAFWPSATLRLSDCVRSARSASLDAVSVITAANLSTMF